MDLPSHLAELTLDRGVDIFLARGNLAFGCDFRELDFDFGEFLVTEQPCRNKSPPVIESGRTVVREELRVVGAEEHPDLGGELAADASRPQRHTTDAAFRSRAAASSTSIAASLRKPSAASCGNASSTP